MRRDGLKVATIRWRRCRGFVKLQVCFRNEATDYGALPWKTTCKDKTWGGFD